MLIMRCLMVLLAAGFVLAGSEETSAQAYPSKPVRIVTADPGGSADVVARLIAQAVAASWGQQVVVENQGGAGGIIAAQTVAKAAPDGYTLLLFSSGIWTLPLMQNVPYDPLRDFSPVTLADRSPNILVVHPTVPANSVKELIVLAKARPGQLNYATVGSGGSTHLAAELFKAMAGVDIVRINYKGAGAALNDLIGNQVQLVFATAGSAGPHIKSGRLKALAVTGAQPSALAPDLPTVASTLPGFEADSTHGIFAPGGTPRPVINRLNEEIVRALNKPEVKEKLLNTGIEIVASTPEQFGAAMRSEMARMGKVIKDAGIRAD